MPIRRRRVGTVQLGAFALHLLEAAADLGGAEPAMTTKGANRGDLASPSPPGDCLGVDAEEGCNLGRRQQGIRIGMIGHRVKSLRCVRFMPNVRTRAFPV